MADDLKIINIPASRTLYFNSKIIKKVALIIDTNDINFELEISKNITHPSDCHPEGFEKLRNFNHTKNMDIANNKYTLQCFDSGGYAPMKLDIEKIKKDINFDNIEEILQNNERFQLEKIFTTKEEFIDNSILTSEEGGIKKRVIRVVNKILESNPDAKFKFAIIKQTNRDNVLVFKNIEFMSCLEEENVGVKIISNNGNFLDVNGETIPQNTNLSISDPKTIYKMKKIPKTGSCYSSIFLDFKANNNINITEGNLRDALINDVPLDFTKLNNLKSIDDPVSIRERAYQRGLNIPRGGGKKKLTKKRKSKKSKKIYKKKKTNKKKKTYKKKKMS